MDITNTTLANLTPQERADYAQALAARLDIALAMGETTPQNRNTDTKATN